MLKAFVISGFKKNEQNWKFWQEAKNLEKSYLVMDIGYSL